MKLKKLTAKGAIGFRDGLGQEEVTVDFEALPPGLVALVGRNGSGKTTLMELATPYRSGPYYDNSYADRFWGREARRELVFELDGHEYRSLFLVDAEHRKMEAYLYQDGEPLNDGKATTYDQVLSDLLGPEELFFRTVFSGQNQARLAEYTPGEAKEFFLKALGIEAIQRQHERAKAVVAALKTGEIDARLFDKSQQEEIAAWIMDGHVLALEARVSAAWIMDGHVLALEARVSATQKQIENIQGALEDEKRLAASVEEQKELVASLAEKERALVQQQQELKVRLERAQAVYTQLRRLKDERRRTDERFEADMRNAKAAAQGIAKEIGQHEAALARIEKILANAQTVRSNATRLAELEDSVETMRALLRELEAARSELQSLQRERQLMKAQRDEWNKAAALVAEVPCHDQPKLVMSCGLLAQAREAQEKVSDMDARLARTKSKLDRLETRVQHLEEDFDDERYRDMMTELNTLGQSDWRAIAAELDRAEAVQEEKKAALAAAKKRRRESEAAVERLSRERSQELGRLATEIGGLQKEADAFTGLTDEENELELALHEARVQLSCARAKLTALERLQAVDQENRQMLSLLHKELKEIKAQQKKLDAELEAWRLLVRATGKDGIQGLELDAAGPGISAIANELLREFGKEWQVRLETQRISADKKKMIEDFRIEVLTPTGVKSYKDLSGGQRVWVNEALEKAVTIYRAQRDGVRSQTLFLDERDGPLDPVARQAYVKCTELLHRRLGAHQTFIVSQSQEVWEALPARIVLNGGVMVEQ